MRRTLLAVTLLAILALLLPSLALAQESGLKPGFRDMKWGDPLPTRGMTRVEGDGVTGYYTRAGDKLAIGSASLQSISYGFFKNRFFTVMITSKRHNGNTLLEVLNQSWGQGYRSNPYIKSWAWLNQDTNDTNALYEIKGSDVGEVFINSKSIFDEMNEARKEKAAKGKKDL